MRRILLFLTLLLLWLDFLAAAQTLATVFVGRLLLNPALNVGRHGLTLTLIWVVVFVVTAGFTAALIWLTVIVGKALRAKRRTVG